MELDILNVEAAVSELLKAENTFMSYVLECTGDRVFNILKILHPFSLINKKIGATLQRSIVPNPTGINFSKPVVCNIGSDLLLLVQG